MKTSIVSENLRAIRHKLFAELLTGRESAAQLLILLDKSAVEDHHGHDGHQSIRELALQISRSFTDSLSELSSCSEFTESPQISAAHDGDGGSSASSEEQGKKEAAAAAVFKDRRGCHKRRKGAFSWIRVSPTDEDGCTWRKYGQKNIMNNKYPRCYFRCTYRSQGCKALKQVQRVEENPHLYHITYFDHHTCGLTPVECAIEPDQDSSMLGFTANFPLKEAPSLAKPASICSISRDLSDAISGKDGADIGFESLGYETIWASPHGREDDVFGLHSSASNGFEGLDMEVNQFDDILDCLFD